jgi:hypothetical protein
MKRVNIKGFDKLIGNSVDSWNVWDVEHLDNRYVIHMEDEYNHVTYIRIWREIVDTYSNELVLKVDIKHIDMNFVIRYEDVKTIDGVLGWIGRRIKEGRLC